MDSTNKGTMWSQAAVKGLILALITVACNTVSYLFLGNTFVSLLTWIVRTVGSIWLLVSFMKQFYEATGQKPFSFALMIVLFSSFICAFYNAAAMAWLFPEIMEQAQEAMSQSMSMFPSEMQSIAAQTADMMTSPRFTFFSTFVGDFIFGLIVAAIANSAIRSKSDIFGGEGNNTDDELA